MTYKLCAVLALLLCTSCGPDWIDCASCRPGEESAESVDGNEQLPVVVIVNVNVNQEQNQTQNQTTNTGGTTSTPDAGTSPDAGSPPQTCRKVCTAYKLHCDQGWHGTNHKGRCTVKKKCVQEAVQCW